MPPEPWRFKGLWALRMGLVVLIAVAVVLIASATKPRRKSVKILLGPFPVEVSAAKGAVPHGLIVLEGAPLSWCRNEPGKSNKFSVDFKPDNTPSQDGKSHFDENDCNNATHLAKAATTNDADVYKYTLTVDGNPIDPHVIIVGGGPIQ